MSSLPSWIDLRRELARRDLLDFTLLTCPGYLPGWVHRDIADKLMAFVEDVVAQRSPRLMILAPPRSGKTELVSRRLPAWTLGRHPDLSIIATSYADSLASANNRDVQRVMDSPQYRATFPGTRLYGSNIRTTAQGTWLRNSDVFEVVNHSGVYKSAGVGGGITGRGGHILIVDDPIKDAEQADSDVYRDKLWDWYTSTLYTRRAPGGGILLIQTRWHEDDLAGRLLQAEKEGGDKWVVARYPAIAEEDEQHRKEGEALHPERYPLLDLLTTKIAVGSRVWESLYQQRPTAASGSIFKREWWKYLTAPNGVDDVKRLLLDLGIERLIQFWDTGFKDKDKNDPSACVTIGVSKNRYIVLDVWKRQVQFPQLKQQAKALYAKWNPDVVLVEDKASGQSLVQELQQGEGRVPVLPIPVDRDKVARANAVTPTVEAGLVYLLTDQPWLADFVDELAGFPLAAHDDQVDAFTGCLSYAKNGGGDLGLFEFYREQAARLLAAKGGVTGVA